jgi:hypothetical protein
MNAQSTSEAVAPSINSILEHHQFVAIPPATLPNGQLVPAFLVGKYLSAIDAAGAVIVSESAVPSVRISYHAARKACADSGLAMLTLAQSTALAINVAGMAENWSGGQVGEGKLMQGLHLGTARGAVDGKFESEKAAERRGFMLSTGDVIFDVAGHLYTWLFDDVQGDANGVVAGPFAAGSPAVVAPFPSLKKGMGWYPDADDDWSRYALLRGGCWCSSSDAGVFRLNLDSPGDGRNGVGFRCTQPIGL